MDNCGNIRKVFLGANTPHGFYSFYDQVIDHENATRIFCIKGGPGMGKSTLMRKIGGEFAAQGYDVEYCLCSSDPSSLDGVRIIDLGIVLLDGTAPHVVDPKIPGAIDEIVNLGDYWNEMGIRRSREEISQLTREVSRLFAKAYGYLAQARILHDELESYYTDANALDIVGLNSLGKGLETLLLNGSKPGLRARERHLFASGITPEGTVNHMETLFAPLSRRCILRGPAGTGKATLVQKLYNAAVNKGVSVEAFHCSLRPEEIEHLIFPELSIGIITGTPPHEFQASPGDIVLDTTEFTYATKLKPYEPDMSEAQRRYNEAFTRGVSFIKRAKAVHDALEAYYVPHMDFNGVNACREKLVGRIRGYAQEK